MSSEQLIVLAFAMATLLPLCSSVVAILSPMLLPGGLGHKGTGLMTTVVMGLSFVCSLFGALQWINLENNGTAIVNYIPWIPLIGSQNADYLYLGIMVDGLTVAMMVMVTFISMLVHVYSIGYMEGDKRFGRFFAYLSLFTFSMLGIVVSNSIMQMFVFWELVGLTSYLLIGFWFEKRGPRLACKKAFVMNRVGDAGFIVGFGILFYQLGGNVMLPGAGGVFNGEPVMDMMAVLAGKGIDVAHAGAHNWWLTIAGIGLFCGAIGKSAQFPLQTWLPDAMEGPTPVSSIVHSATMVAAGVYLTGRIYPLLTPDAHLFIATIGLITLVMAAMMAMVMTDIKKVLAYSTLSQLGYMVLGMGVGAWGFALFHLITHAFFKCCLFQCSGSVIHAAHHEQDMRQYGGLWRKMPITAVCYGVCTLAIAGASIPFSSLGMSGFYSKDGIIAGAFNYGHVMNDAGWMGWLFWLGPVVIAYVTPFYMARSFALTFLGKPRNEHLHDHAHEVGAAMKVPQLFLMVLAIISGFLYFDWMIEKAQPAAAAIQPMAAVADHHGYGIHLTHAVLLQGFGWILAIGAGILLYLPGMQYASKIAAVPGINIIYKLCLRKFYFDALYDGLAVALGKAWGKLCSAFDKYVIDGDPATAWPGFVNGTALMMKNLAMGVGSFDKRGIDGAVNGAANFARQGGELLRHTQTGRVRTYVLTMFAASGLVLLVVLTVVLSTR
jgi:NADH-quinone oxidoreductase subunit L